MRAGSCLHRLDKVSPFDALQNLTDGVVRKGFLKDGFDLELDNFTLRLLAGDVGLPLHLVELLHEVRALLGVFEFLLSVLIGDSRRGLLDNLLPLSVDLAGELQLELVLLALQFSLLFPEVHLVLLGGRQLLSLRLHLLSEAGQFRAGGLLGFRNQDLAIGFEALGDFLLDACALGGQLVGLALEFRALLLDFLAVLIRLLSVFLLDPGAEVGFHGVADLERRFALRALNLVAGHECSPYATKGATMLAMAAAIPAAGVSAAASGDAGRPVFRAGRALGWFFLA